MGKRTDKASASLLSRRSILKTGAAAVAAQGLGPLGSTWAGSAEAAARSPLTRGEASRGASAQPPPRIAVIGAGAFGGWTALYLRRLGAAVTLFDAWGPGKTRVCQFENSLDKNFIIDRHPATNNVWIVGGGSGHGFKHGPAVGARAARMILGETPVEEVFSRARFKAD